MTDRQTTKFPETFDASPELIHEIVSTAERMLSQRFGGEQILSDPRQLSGDGDAIVVRAKVAPSPFLQARSVVVKYMPSAVELHHKATLIREIVSYQFTTSLPEEVRPGPVLLAYDIDAQLLIISDSGDGSTFAELLHTQDERTRLAVLRSLGEAIGRMHAGTATREHDFQVLHTRLLAKYPEVAPVLDNREGFLDNSIALGQKIMEVAGVTIPESVRVLAEEARRRLAAGQHRAFTPFDLSPDNIIMADRPHFLDYEWAGFRDTGFDLACVVAGFPQVLTSRPVSDEEARAFIDAWVDEVVDLWPNVANRERLIVRIATALIGWSFSSLAVMHIGFDEELFSRTFGSHSTFVISDDEALAEIIEKTTPRALRVLSDMNPPLDSEIRLIRKDLYETFEAIARFVRTGTDPRLAGVAEYADAMARRLYSAV